MRLLFFLLIFLFSAPVFSQKMLLIERAKKAKTTKLYIGDQLHFRMRGSENYWYERTITDILPQSNTLILDGFAVHLDSISAIKVFPNKGARILGGALTSLGVTLPLSLFVAKVFYNDQNVKYAELAGVSAGSLAGGYLLLKKRKRHLGNKYRLRIVEIKFPDPIIPPPTFRKN
jgi:hypothetical protein